MTYLYLKTIITMIMNPNKFIFIYKYIHKYYVFIEMTILLGFNKCKKKKTKNETGV